MLLTWKAMISTPLDVERHEVRAKSERWIIGEQVYCHFGCDESVVLLNRLPEHSTHQRVHPTVHSGVDVSWTVQHLIKLRPNHYN